MERFVRLVVGGGLALLAGTWVSALAPEFGRAGVALALVGAGLLLAGVGSRLERRDGEP